EIHRLSPRADGPLMVLDCGAVPPNLMESELFGHEKGAFTGAVATRQGLFELAHGGTLFIDELGELPLDLQPKLLRALERREIQALGSDQVTRVDVRVVAATHRNLNEMVNESLFRQDLFYRLSVVEIRIPPLRERREDIPALVSHFLAQIGPGVKRVSAVALAALQRAPWPGNVRELKNAVVRAHAL